MTDATVTDLAAKNLRVIAEHLEGIAFALGKTSPLYIESVNSWIQTWRQIAGWMQDGGRLVADGRLSLGMNTFIYIGVIFFRDRSFDGCEVTGEDDRVYACTNHGKPYRYESWTCTEIEDGDEAKSHMCYRVTTPTPGTWSCHS